MHYQPYFNLALFHDYYQNRICPDFTIEPTRACQRILKGHRLVFKPSINGLQLFIPTESSENLDPLLPLDESLIFTFLLKLKNSDFITFTQLESSYQPGKSLYVFSNETIKGKGDLELKRTLIQREKLAQSQPEASSVEARCAAIAELHAAPASQLLGVIEIHNQDFLKSADQPRGFTITFAAKEQLWTYYLIADKSAAETAFSIQSKDATIPFSSLKAENSDRIVAGIQQRFPESQTVLLRSNAPVACHEMGRANLQLFKQEPKKEESKKEATTVENKLLISNLPNPSARQGIQIINLLKEV